MRTTQVRIHCVTCDHVATARSGEAAVEGYEEHVRWHGVRASREQVEESPRYNRAAG